MKHSLHQNEDSRYRHTDIETEAKIKQENDVSKASHNDITIDENIVEIEEAARSDEGLDLRQDHLLREDVSSDREDNNEPPPLDLPSSAIKS